MTRVPRRVVSAGRHVSRTVTKPTPVNALRAGVAVNRATGGPLTWLASLVALMMLTCWVFWTYLLPALPGGWMVKRGLQFGIEHIDCQQSSVQAQPAVDPGTAGLAWVLGHGLRKVATWDPSPETIHSGIVGAAHGIGSVWGSFRSGLDDGAAPHGPARTAQPSAYVVGGCCGGTAPGAGLPMNAARAVLAAPSWATESPAHKVLAVAIAQAESADQPDAVNPREVAGSRARGLWQIMLPMHADVVHGAWSDPVVNADAAHAVLAAQGFAAWDTYRDGSYTAHLTDARAALDAARGGTTCSSNPVLPANAEGGTVIGYARAQLGTPYVWGGAEPGAFDCSGLVQYVYARVGIETPRTAEEQRQWAAPVRVGDVQPGDLVFFEHAPGQPAHHVGLVVAPGRMIDSPHRGDVVRERAIFGGEVITYGRPVGHPATA